MSRKNIIDRVLNRPSESRGSQPSGLLLVLFVEAKRINPFPFGNFRGFANLDSAHTGGGFGQAASRHFSGRRGAAPYLYTQSVCAACFASILRRTSRLLGVPGREHFPAFEKAGQNTDSTPGVLFYGCPAFCGSCRTA